MTRSYTNLSATDTEDSFPTTHNNNFASVISHHLSTSGGAPSYKTDGMLFITDTAGSGSGYQYFFVEDGASVPAFSALLIADDSDKDWNLAHHENFVLENTTTVPAVLTKGRMVLVDTGTNDDGFFYVCDSSAFRRVLTDRSTHSSSDASRYYRHQYLTPDQPILSLTNSSSVSWTSLNVASLVSPLAHLSTDLDAMLLVNVSIADSGGRATISFRKNGASLDTGKKTVATVAAETGVAQFGQFWVPAATGTIDYQLVSSGTNTATVSVTVEAAIAYS